MRYFRTILTLFVCGLVLFPRTVHAARIYFSPEMENIHVGDTVTVDVLLDTEKESINAVDLTILYPQLVSIKSIVRTGSLLTLWIQEPSFTARNIVLQGGVPGGIVTGHGLIAKLVIQADAIGTGDLVPDPSSTVLRNDGAGTSAHLTTGSLTINAEARAPNATPVSSEPATVSGTTPPKAFPVEPVTTSDTIPPQAFSILIGSDPSVFGGKNFASFFTTDASSGVDHYEISEGGGVFRIARSPFLLSDQQLHSVIRVRAYDTAGNYRDAVWPGFFRRVWWWIIGLFGFH